MEEADIFNSSLTILGSNSPYYWIYDGSHIARIAFSLLEQGRLAVSHIRFNGSINLGLSYTLGLPLFLGSIALFGLL